MSATLILLSAISLGCGRPGQAEVAAQDGPGVFGAGDTALLAGSAPRGRRTTERDADQEYRRRRQEREHGSRIIAALERA
jgi:hypothetical protein